MNEVQQTTLRAALDCVIPPDDFPGAWDAGVGNYLARQFESDLASRVEFYLSGLDGLETEALARFDHSFSRLTSGQQHAILQSVETGNVVASWTISPQDFFELFVNTAAEGYYSNPEQGGNIDAVSWVMTGFSECEPS